MGAAFECVLVRFDKDDKTCRHMSADRHRIAFWRQPIYHRIDWSSNVFVAISVRLSALFVCLFAPVTNEYEFLHSARPRWGLHPPSVQHRSTR